MKAWVEGLGLGEGRPRVNWLKGAIHNVAESREGLFCRAWISMRSLW